MSAHLRPDVTSPAPEQGLSWPQTFERGGCYCAGEYLFPDFVSPEEEAQLIHMLDHEEPAWRDSSFNGKYRWGHVPVLMVLQSYCWAGSSRPPDLVAACDPASRAVCGLIWQVASNPAMSLQGWLHCSLSVSEGGARFLLSSSL